MKRNRRKSFGILCAILSVCIATIGLLAGKARERKAVVSEVVAGYRYRCTLSTRWKLVRHNATEDYSSFSLYPSPVREWIAIHLLHQPPAVRSMRNRASWPSELLLRTYLAKDLPGSLIIVEGYPRWTVRPPGPGISERHLHIDGCPATVVRFEITSPSGPKVMKGTCLFVSLPDYACTYSAFCYTMSNKNDPQYRDQIDEEMEDLVSSFHVEKVPGLSAGNHGGMRREP